MPAKEPIYRVSYPDRLRNQVKTMLESARIEGNLKEIENALIKVDERLQSDPLNFGEQIKFLPIVQWIVHVGIVRPILVEFGVDQTRRIVFVNRIENMEPAKE